MVMFIHQHELVEKSEVPQFNLYKDSADFGGSSWIANGDNLQASNELDPNGNKTINEDWQWKGINQPLNLLANDIITLGAFIKPSSTSSGKIGFYCTGSGFYARCRRLTLNGKICDLTTSDVGNGFAKIISSNQMNKWNWVTVTFLITDNGIYNSRFEVPDNSSFLIGSIIAVKSNSISRWYPALSDYVLKSDLDSIKSDIQALKTKVGGVIKHAICLVTARKAVA